MLAAGDPKKLMSYISQRVGCIVPANISRIAPIVPQVTGIFRRDRNRDAPLQVNHPSRFSGINGCSNRRGPNGLSALTIRGVAADMNDDAAPASCHVPRGQQAAKETGREVGQHVDPLRRAEDMFGHACNLERAAGSPQSSTRLGCSCQTGDWSSRDWVRVPVCGSRARIQST